jgi:hypothetical protein
MIPWGLLGPHGRAVRAPSLVLLPVKFGSIRVVGKLLYRVGWCKAVLSHTRTTCCGELHQIRFEKTAFLPAWWCFLNVFSGVSRTRDGSWKSSCSSLRSILIVCIPKSIFYGQENPCTHGDRFWVERLPHS